MSKVTGFDLGDWHVHIRDRGLFQIGSLAT